MRDLEVYLQREQISPFVGIKMFSDSAEKELKRAQEDASENIFLRAKCYSLVTRLFSKAVEVKMSLGINFLEKEVDMAKIWLAESEKFLEDISKPPSSEIPVLSSMNDAKNYEVYFSSLSDEHKKELSHKISSGKQRIMGLESEIARLTDIAIVDMEVADIELIEKILPGYKFIG